MGEAKRKSRITKLGSTTPSAKTATYFGTLIAVLCVFEGNNRMDNGRVRSAVYHRPCCKKPMPDRLVAELDWDVLKSLDVEGDSVELAIRPNLLWHEWGSAGEPRIAPAHVA